VIASIKKDGSILMAIRLRGLGNDYLNRRGMYTASAIKNPSTVEWSV
jgi:hypothetical protein